MSKAKTLFSRWFYDNPYMLINISMLCWAGNFVVGRGAEGDISPIMLAFSRWGGAAIVLLPFAIPYLKKDWHVIRENIKLLIILAILGISTFNTVVYFGLQYTTAINGVIFQSIAPVMIGLITFILFREIPTWAQITGIIVSFCGIAVIIAHGNLAELLELSFNPGDIIIFFAFWCWASYCVLLRKRPKMHPFSFLAITVILGASFLTPVALYDVATNVAFIPSLKSFGIVVYLVLFPAILAYICNNRAVELMGANATGPFYHMSPVYGAILAMLILGESLQLYHLAGFGLIISGIAIATLKVNKEN